MAEGESGSHKSIDNPQTTKTCDGFTSECLTSQQQPNNESISNVTSGSNSDESELHITGAIPKIHQQLSTKFHCTMCNVEYNRRLDYVLHVRQNHTSNEKFKCDLCVKLCSNYPALMRHKIMAHTSTRYT